MKNYWLLVILKYTKIRINYRILTEKIKQTMLAITWYKFVQLCIRKKVRQIKKLTFRKFIFRRFNLLLIFCQSDSEGFFVFLFIAK